MNYGSVTLRTLLLMAVLAGVLTSAAPVTAQPDFSQFTEDPTVLYGEQARYEVLRNGKSIGTHSVSFRKKATGLDVRVESSLAVRYLGVPVYRYSYIADENWEAGKFVASESRIKENLKKLRVIRAEVKGRVLEITDRDRTRTAPLARFPSNHWHPAVLRQSRVFHTLHGRVHHVKIQLASNDKIELRGLDANQQKRIAVVRARRYRYSGGFSADVWYDTSWRWVQLQFNADDGSQIVYRCTTCLPHAE